MRKDIVNILIALGIGLFIFSMRYVDNGNTSFGTFKYQVFLCGFIYFGMKRYFNKKITVEPNFKIKFGHSFFVGFQLLTIAALFSSLLYLLMPDPVGILFECSKIIRTLDVFVSTLVIGMILDAMLSGYFVYRQF